MGLMSFASRVVRVSDPAASGGFRRAVLVEAIWTPSLTLPLTTGRLLLPAPERPFAG